MKLPGLISKMLMTALMLAACSTASAPEIDSAPPGIEEQAPAAAETAILHYPEGSLAEYLQEQGRFSTFLEITEQIIHEHAPPVLLDASRSWTLFVPNNEAFDELPQDVLAQLRTDDRLAQELLFHHAFDKPVSSGDFQLLQVWPTVITPVKVSFTFEGNEIYYDGARILETDIGVGGSIVHVLESVAGIELLTD